MPILYSKKWKDENGDIRYFIDEEARNNITILKSDSTVSGSIDNKILEAINNFPIATNNTAGKVKPDGTTIVVDSKGVISSNGGSNIEIDYDSITFNDNNEIQAVKVNGHTVEADVPSNAIFTDTTALSSMTGTLQVSQGGTGANSATEARTNLGLGSAALKATTDSVTSTSSDLPVASAVYSAVHGTKNVSEGGTGRTNLTSGYALVGNGTSAVNLKAIDTTPSNSSNLITSGGVYNALSELITTTTSDPGEGSTLAYGHLLVVLS